MTAAGPMPVSVYAWFGGRASDEAPQPPRMIVDQLLSRTATLLTWQHLRPIDGSLHTEIWERPEGFVPAKDNDFLACITVEVETGSLPRSLQSWFQWQHPKWIWSAKPFPQAKVLEVRA